MWEPPPPAKLLRFLPGCIYALKTAKARQEAGGKLQERWQQLGRVKPSKTGGYVTLQDERQEVEELQMAVLHVCLDVLAHEGPAG